MSDISKLFQSVKLPVMPEVAHALIRTLHDADASLMEVRKLIAKDPTLTAKVLRLANSAGYGLQREVSSLDEATALVGLLQVRTLALTACLNVAFPMSSGLDRSEFWRFSMACAGYAQWLAGALQLDSQQAWLTGMMARLGELLIASHSPASLLEIEKLPHIPGDRWKREQRALGYSEVQVTAELARRWNFPLGIVDGLNAATDPLSSQAINELGAVLHLAAWLADMPFSEAAIVDALPVDVITALGLDREWMRTNLPRPDSFFDVSDL